MDLVKGLEQTLSGRVKPMITTCSMRHLKAMNTKETGVSAAIQQGYSEQFERRRCGHHPDEYPEPLSALECLSEVVDPKDTGINKHRYVVASNEHEVRASLRLVRGVPLIYINRSVMIMEPMAEGTSQQRSREERQKLRAELRQPNGQKRKRDEDEDEDENIIPAEQVDGSTAHSRRDASSEANTKKMKTARGPRAPNPLSVKKKKKSQNTALGSDGAATSILQEADASQNEGAKKKRKRKKKKSANGSEAIGTLGDHPTETES
jgi:U3 small nucleolar RNA-associated protein 23